MSECPKCARPLLTSGVDHCMYCGAELPEALRASPQQKQARREQLRVAADQEIETLQQQRKREIEHHDSEPSDFGFGGDCGSDGGGGTGSGATY